MVPLMQTAVAPAVINSDTPLNNSFFSGAGDFLSQGLDVWMKYEQVQKVKDAGGVSQDELNKTVQTPSPASAKTSPNPAADLRDKMSRGLQIGTGTLGLVVGGVALLYFLTRRK